MITKETSRLISDNSKSIIDAVMRRLMVEKLNRRIAYWRYKRIHSKKFGCTWRRCNRAIAMLREETTKVISPTWCQD